MATYEQQETFAMARMGGIGGSDVAAILGLSPFRTAIEVWESKVYPERVAELDKECVWFGNALEPVIRGRYAIRNGIEVIDPVKIADYFPNSRKWNDQTIVIGDEPWMLGTADGWIPSEQDGLEIKNVGRKGEDWGTENTDEIPAYYVTQCMWYIPIHKAKGWRVAPLFSGNTLGNYLVKRDDGLIYDMVNAARDFFKDFVERRIEPPIDQTESYGRYLARKFSLSTGQVIKNPSMALTEAALNLKTAQDATKEAESNEQLRKNQLAAMLADSDAAITPFGKVQWVRGAPRISVDYKAVIAEAKVDDEIVAKHTKESPVSPYVRGYWKK
jgi:putative phage-type endonuclease